MTCTAMSNLPSPESQISCPTIVWYCLNWSWLQNSDESLSGWSPPTRGVLDFFGFSPKVFHMTQVPSQHTSLGLQQGYHLHLLYIHNQDDN